VFNWGKEKLMNYAGRDLTTAKFSHYAIRIDLMLGVDVAIFQYVTRSIPENLQKWMDGRWQTGHKKLYRPLVCSEPK
jgi:hypothetical protein